MIECLSNPNWIHPQVDFLLFLQNIRINQPEIVEKLFLSITVFGEFWLPTLICSIIYWCIDFKSGIYLFSLEGFNVILAHFFKMIACVYRPWILDSQIKPSATAYAFAKGYSFPSGHSAMSSSVFGGLAYLLRKKWVPALLLVILVLLIGFSRMFLGVHTPQDVICGFLIGIILIFAINPLINWAEKNKKRYLYLIAVVNVISVFAVLFIYYWNTYKLDYVAGELLVNPAIQKYGAVTLYMYGLGLLNGCYLCRYFCPFNPKETSLKRRIVRGLTGALAIILFLRPIVLNILLSGLNIKMSMLIMFMLGISVTLIYPLIFIGFDKLIKQSQQ